MLLLILLLSILLVAFARLLNAVALPCDGPAEKREFPEGLHGKSSGWMGTVFFIPCHVGFARIHTGTRTGLDTPSRERDKIESQARTPSRDELVLCGQRGKLEFA